MAPGLSLSVRQHALTFLSLFQEILGLPDGWADLPSDGDGFFECLLACAFLHELLNRSRRKLAVIEVVWARGEHVAHGLSCKFFL